MSATEVEKREAALAAVRKIRDCTVYIVPSLVLGVCKGGGATDELRQGFCFACLEPYLDTAEEMARNERKS